MISTSKFKNLDLRRIGFFLLFIYGGAILTASIIALNGGLQNTSLVFFLLPTIYMWSPALANILTRFITHEPKSALWLKPNFKRGWIFWLAAWFVPGLLIMLGGGLYFLIFPQSFDPNMPIMQKAIALSGKSLSMPLWQLALLQISSGMLISPLINCIFTFGEEYGWRAYLLQKLLPLGYRKALILLSIIWGTWHWPIIILGYNYGLSYPGAPFPGMLLFVWVCFCFSVFLSWTVLKAGSVWPAVIGHAAINGMAGAATLFLSGDANILLGPSVQGIFGVMGFALLAIVLFIHPGELPALPYSENLQADEPLTE
jgi:uncharacterized protein